MRYICSSQCHDGSSGEAVRVVRERCTLPRLDVAALDETVWQELATALMREDILKKALDEHGTDAGTGEWESQKAGATKALTAIAKEEAQVLRLMGEDLD